MSSGPTFKKYYKTHWAKYKEYRRKSHLKLKPRARFIIENLKRRPCEDCQGWFEPCQMEFDHIDPTTKKYNLSNLRTSGVKTLLDEIAKCRIICSNCHALRTYQMQHQEGYWQINRPRKIGS